MAQCLNLQRIDNISEYDLYLDHSGQTHRFVHCRDQAALVPLDSICTHFSLVKVAAVLELTVLSACTFSLEGTSTWTSY